METRLGVFGVTESKTTKVWTKLQHETGEMGLNPFRVLSGWGLKKLCLQVKKRGPETDSQTQAWEMYQL